jgi:hypothetical protein
LKKYKAYEKFLKPTTYTNQQQVRLVWKFTALSIWTIFFSIANLMQSRRRLCSTLLRRSTVATNKIVPHSLFSPVNFIFFSRKSFIINVHTQFFYEKSKVLCIFSRYFIAKSLYHSILLVDILWHGAVCHSFTYISHY